MVDVNVALGKFAFECCWFTSGFEGGFRPHLEERAGKQKTKLKLPFNE